MEKAKIKPTLTTTWPNTYRLIGNKDKEAYYLAKTAIIDLESGVTEYIALPKLAELLFKNGNIERAYNYLLCSIEDANYCKARLRAIEATNIFPIIEKAYKEMNHRRRLTEYALFHRSVLADSLAGLCYLFLTETNAKKCGNSPSIGRNKPTTQKGQ